VCFAHPAWPWRMRTAHRSLSACGVDHARAPPPVGAISPCAASGTRPQALSTEQVDYSSLLTCPSYTRVACQPDSTASASSSMPERAPGSSGAGLRRFVRRREEGGRAVIARGGRPNLHAHGARLPSLGRLWLEGAPRHRLGRPWAAHAARQVGQFYAVCAVVLVCVGSCLDGRRRRAHRCVSRLMCRCACFCRCGGSPRRFCESSASALGPAASQPAREQWRAGPRSPTCVASFTVQDARSTAPPGPGRSWGADGA